ncbi:MAG: 50S ribosomal protein L5 [Microgenomates group bacterium GW2011_GWC1_37_8]|uniref:Large ribosomal subunit protein uL5 n=1 Tax=Candidatus Woesebacteria bacterium GW2011_GWB1_38_8 TaxID=1618570 RepID=A0A0G0NJB4_9BACT|nr:MAG: 50S ribosomal protein L5 [Microgenomates group bacterium GW2011_GWC1_37_8]KKQ86009.1 MAG: 50S ribosomal protein L5 [Candidatus Woesebacteria bacterium GW2011_GWB1_38_8]
MIRLKQKYQKEVISQLLKEIEVKNNMAVPKIEKVVVNMGIGEVAKNKEMLDQVKKDMAVITGQMPQIRGAKVSVASFGIRRGMPVGLRVTLRNEKMYSFLDKLFSIVLPRLRDFRGVSKSSFDRQGNYTLGIVEHTVFPEIDITKSQSRGLEITIVTKSKDIEKSMKLLELLGMPFEKGE